MLKNKKGRARLKNILQIAIIACAAFVVLTIIVNTAASTSRSNRLNKLQREADDYLEDIVNQIEFNGLTPEVQDQIANYSSNYTGYSNFVMVDSSYQILYSLNEGYLDGTGRFFPCAVGDVGSSRYRDILFILDAQGNLMSSLRLSANNRAALTNLSKPLEDKLYNSLRLSTSGEAVSEVVSVDVTTGDTADVYSFDINSLSADSDHFAKYFGFPSKNMHLFMLYDGVNPVYESEVSSMEASRSFLNAMAGVAVILGLLYWLLVPVWVFTDASREGNHPALWSILALFTNAVGLVVYLVVRPEPLQCKACKEPISAEYIVCPVCGARNRETCEKCGRIVDENWNVCPYCTTAIEREAHEAHEHDAPPATGDEA